MIYLDHAATTKPEREVVEAMLPYLSHFYGNASSAYTFATESRRAIRIARDHAAKLIGCTAGEICFTSGGTESDNQAIKMAAESRKKNGNHLITTAIEHPAVLQTMHHLETCGFEVTYLMPDREGRVSADAVRAAIRPTTILVSVMYANNEIGTVQEIGTIGEITRERGILLHTDAVQAYGKMAIDVKKEKIDLLSASGHKIGGPKGVGILYVREGLSLPALLDGGGQEYGMRSGTENVPAIAGFGEAARLCAERMDERREVCEGLREHLLGGIRERFPEALFNGCEAHHVPGFVNISLPHVPGGSVISMLSRREICASAASACAAGSDKPSYVIRALGRTHAEAEGTLRFTIGADNTVEEIDRTLDALDEIVQELRKLHVSGRFG